MYDIVTLEPEDAVVKTAINAIVKGQGAIPGPDGNYRFIARNAVLVEGDGGADSAVLVVVGHGDTNRLSGCKTWSEFKGYLGGDIDWQEKGIVFLAACATAQEGGLQFLHGNIANDIKKNFPHATVWASASNVSASTQQGDWQKL